jgi:hypothetical protein
MKRFSFFLALALIIASFGMVSANSVSLDATTGTWVDTLGVTKIIPNAPVTFDIRLTSTHNAKINGISNGFVISGPTSFDPLAGDTILAGWGTLWDLAKGVFTFSNGSGADTVAFSSAVIGGAGLAIGYDDVPYRLTTGNIPEGETLCLDSAWYPPGGTWKWALPGLDLFPTWDGPHCFLSEMPSCQGPTIDNAPLSLVGSHCNVMSFDFDATLNQLNLPVGGLEWAADLGTIDANGVWSYAPTLADVGASMSVTITASNTLGNPAGCGTDVVVNLTFTNEAPVLNCSAGGGDVSAGIATVFNISATDDCDPITFSIADDGGTVASIDPMSGELTVTPPMGVDSNYTIVVEASDGNASSTCNVDIHAVVGSLFQVEIPCFGAPEGPVFQGQHVSIPVNLATGNTIDGYDLLIGYDNSALSFQNATPGADLVADGWEYFTYRYGANGNCSNACPSGLLRLTAIAETNNGPNHPTLDGVTELAVLDFLVTNDRTLECQSIPVRFYWMDCGDNTLSTDLGNTLHISEAVFDGDEVLFPPNGNDIQDGTYGFPTYFGAQDECIIPAPGKPVPVRDVSFNNGCVFIACADAIDARGDINLNNVANEIADAVLYSNYFIYSIGVFTINTEGQIAASDVNADGLALSVADLVYLIRIIVGDALPYPKLAPVNAKVINDKGIVSVDAEMGAALVVIEGNVQAQLLAENMEMISNFDGSNTRVLVYSLEGNSFSGDFLNANGEIVSVELGSADGATVNAKVIPANFELAQNYPNPFNPSTNVSFSVPYNSDVTLTIYNVTGQKVTEFSGSYEAGIHTITWDASSNASGIYFYKINAGDFSDTKKMVLLK